MKYSAGLLLTLLPLSMLAAAELSAADEMSCTVDVLGHLGWELVDHSEDIGFENTDTCNTDYTPVFKYNSNTEDPESLITRARHTFNSISTKCLFSRNYQKSIKSAVDKLIENEEFKFLPSGRDPRDPFLPPEGTWDTTTARGYDIPHQSIQSSIQSLYKKPFVAECSTAAQIAQLASLTEHYGSQTDDMLQLNEVGIGTWTQYTRVPSIAAKQSLFINRSDRADDGLKKLAKNGRAAFYGQLGYLKPLKGTNYIDSLDNLGQNYLIVEISDKAVAAIKARRQPLKELSKISRKVWKDFRKRQKQGVPMETLRKEMQTVLEAADPFFSDIEVYVHPLYVNNFAKHIARQFQYNPRTPYVLEVYEDYQPGFFYNRYIDYQIEQCMDTTAASG